MPEMKTLNGYEIVDAKAREDIEYLKTKEVDLSSYYNKNETENLVNEAVGNINIPEVPANVSAFNNDAGYLTEHQSLDGLASETYVDETINSVKFCVLDIYNCIKVTDTYWQLTANVKNIVQRLFDGERFPIVVAPYSHLQYIPSEISVTSDEIKIYLDILHGITGGKLTALNTDSYVFTNTNGSIGLQIRTSKIDVTDAYEYQKQLTALEARIAALEGNT